MGQAQINVRTRACSGTSIARTKQAALTHNVRGKELIIIIELLWRLNPQGSSSESLITFKSYHQFEGPLRI